MTMPKKLASGQGMVSLMRMAASGIDRPTCWASTMRRNSVFTGSGNSLAISRMPSLSGRPDLTARTITSSALGNSFEESLDAAGRGGTTNQRGKPERAGKQHARQHDQWRAQTNAATT